MFFSKKVLGIDIGTASIKVVELSSRGKNKKLENYGEMSLSFVKNEDENTSNNMVASTIAAILNEARIKTKKAIFSIPDFLSFCTSFKIPQMTPEEIPGAIYYNAAQYITLPTSEVTLDWQVMQNAPGDKSSPLRVFVVAIPNQVVKNYQTIAKLAGLDLYALEPEAFSITRALTQNNPIAMAGKKIVCLLDIGAKTSTISIASDGYLQMSYSSNFNSQELSKSLSLALKVDYTKAEEIKNKEGFLSSRKEVIDVLSLSMESVITEIKSIFADFTQKEKKEVDELYITGGMANLPGLKEYFKRSFNKEVFVPNCFLNIYHPPILNDVLSEMNPRFSAAVGVALFGLQN